MLSCQDLGFEEVSQGRYIDEGKLQQGGQGNGGDEVGIAKKVDFDRKSGTGTDGDRMTHLGETQSGEYHAFPAIGVEAIGILVLGKDHEGNGNQRKNNADTNHIEA